MTMAELHTLYEQYFPSAPPHQHEQGRAGVTARVVTNVCYDNLQSVPPLRIDAPSLSYLRGRYRTCPACGKELIRPRGTRKKYCNDACKQRAYRQRKKAGK